MPNHLDLVVDLGGTYALGDNCETAHAAFLGVLQPGECGYATIEVRGGPACITCKSERIRVSTDCVTGPDGELRVEALPGPIGGLIWELLTLHNEYLTVTVTIIAQWSEGSVRAGRPPLDTALHQNTVQVESAPEASPDRTYSGRNCRLCGRNFSYDLERHAWETCTCGPKTKVRRCLLRFAHEVRGGVSETVQGLKEIWSVLLGRDG